MFLKSGGFMPKKEEKMTKEEVKRKAKEDKETVEFIDSAFKKINELMDVNLPHMHIADKVFFIASAIARSHSNDISMIWSMDSVVAAFDKELEEYSQLKINARTKVSEQLKVFNNKFETVDPVQISKPEAIN